MSNTAEVINFPIKTELTGGRMADLSMAIPGSPMRYRNSNRGCVSGREWQCLEAVIWLTYGWNKKQDRVTNTVISELTGLSDSHVSDAIKLLAARGLFLVTSMA
jgi:phage replication O-like protein O